MHAHHPPKCPHAFNTREYTNTQNNARIRTCMSSKHTQNAHVQHNMPSYTQCAHTHNAACTHVHMYAHTEYLPPRCAHTHAHEHIMHTYTYSNACAQNARCTSVHVCTCVHTQNGRHTPAHTCRTRVHMHTHGTHSHECTTYPYL